VTAQKDKEEAIIIAEGTKKKAELEAEAIKAQILRQAEAEAEKIRLAKLAEAEGKKKVLEAEAEGKRLSLLAEAEAEQQKALAPAMAFEKMIQAAGSPELAVQWKMVDQYKGIAEAQAHALEHINMGNVTVYGNTSTGADFAKSFVEKFAPALDIINSGVKGQFKGLFGLDNKDNQQIENKSEKENQGFENVK
jgi:flotillin